jgi:hypothetical protein
MLSGVLKKRGVNNTKFGDYSALELVDFRLRGGIIQDFSGSAHLRTNVIAITRAPNINLYQTNGKKSLV